jgi:hypothetical protein
MSLEDLATCEAEVITPIKYDFKVGTAGDDGVTLWEVRCPTSFNYGSGSNMSSAHLMVKV